MAGCCKFGNHSDEIAKFVNMTFGIMSTLRYPAFSVRSLNHYNIIIYIYICTISKASMANDEVTRK